MNKRIAAALLTITSPIWFLPALFAIAVVLIFYNMYTSILILLERGALK